MAEATTTVDEAGDGTEYVPRRARGWGIPILLTVVVAVLLGGVALLIGTVTGDRHSAETVTFVVPDGTAEDLFFGKKVDIMPPKVELKVGDTLVIRNDDSQTASVGPFTVRAGETLKQTFRRPQTLIGECTLSGTGEVKIIVT
jgi:hypothetical protein